MCAKDLVPGAFAAINADDFYGAGAFREAAAFLTGNHTENEHAMVAYHVENTLTENGSVSRGVCTVENGLLGDIEEKLKIVPCEGGAKVLEDGGDIFLPAGTPVSMNMWAFSHSMLDEMEARFPAWLDENIAKNPLKCEYFLPLIPRLLIQEGKGRVHVRTTRERWYGVTYHADLENVQNAIEKMRREGKYPTVLWK